MDGANVLLSLRPRNEAATEVIHLERNKNLRSCCMLEDILSIGHIESKAANDNCIATLGRGPNADIAVPEEWMTVSNFQCEFLVLNNSCIEFADTSSNVSCQAYGDSDGTLELLSDNCRKAYSSSGLCRIEFKIDQSRTADFDIIWQYQPNLTLALQAWRNAVLQRRQPAMADTQVLPAADPEPESQRLPPYAAGTSTTDVATLAFDDRPIGCGAFGAVYRVKNRKTKQVFAAKLQPRSRAVEREVQILKSLGHHPNIVHFYGHEFRKDAALVQIYMGLMDGSLDDMVRQNKCPGKLGDNVLARLVYHDVLKGLDYVHSKGFVHRDIKPANILWTLRNGNLSFCLADFGLSNSQSLAQTFCGSPMFTAPEVKFDYPQTTAMDLWSLFITVLWTADFDHFRNVHWQKGSDILLWVVSLAQRRWNDLALVHELVVLDPKDRATAPQMLVKVFGGEGLTTRRENIPKLQTVMVPRKFKDPDTKATWLYQLVRPVGMPAQEPIDEKPLPGDHVFRRIIMWPVNKEENPQVVNGQFGVRGGIVVAPKGKVFKNCHTSPVAGQPRVTKQTVAARKRLVIRGAIIRHVGCQTKGSPAAGAWLGQLRQTPGFFPV